MLPMRLLCGGIGSVAVVYLDYIVGGLGVAHSTDATMTALVPISFLSCTSV